MGNQACCQQSINKFSESEAVQPHFPDLIDTARKHSVSNKCRVRQSMYKDDNSTEHPLSSRRTSTNNLSLALDVKRDSSRAYSPNRKVKRTQETDSSVETYHVSSLHTSPLSVGKRKRNNKYALESLEDLLEPVLETQDYAAKLNHTISQAFVSDYDHRQLGSLLTSFERTLSARDAVSRQNFDTEKDDLDQIYQDPRHSEIDYEIINPECTFRQNKSQKRNLQDLKIDLSFMESRVMFDTSASLKLQIEEDPFRQTKDLGRIREGCTPRFTAIPVNEGTKYNRVRKESQDSVECFNINS